MIIRATMCYTVFEKIGGVITVEDFLSPKSDLIFKLLFGDIASIDLLTDFLKSVLRLPSDDYEEVTLIDPHLELVEISISQKEGGLRHDCR
jgi:hypothetical protein